MSFHQPFVETFLKGPEIYLPEQVITNQNLIDWMGAKIRDSWIEHRTGIRERRWTRHDEACSDLGFQAAQKLLNRIPEEREQIKTLIVATISGDYPTPPTSPLLQDRLSLKNVGAFDLGAACAGFVTGLHTASCFLAATNQTVLLISSDVRSKFLSKDDFATTALFGDGAASLVVSPNSKNSRFRLIASQLFSDGSVADMISISAGGSRLPYSINTEPENTFLKMKKGAVLFLKAAEGMAESARVFLQRLSLTPQDIDWIVPHQANLHLIREVARKLEVPPEKMIETVQFTGNTSGASVGIGLHFLVDKLNGVKRQKVLLLSAGGGGLAACALLETT